MKSPALTAFFSSREEAELAFRDLRRKGYRRTALIHKDAHGRVDSSVGLLRRKLRNGNRSDYERVLESDESVLILEAPIASLRHPVSFLRSVGEIPPAIFFLNPKRPQLVEDMGTLESPPPPAQMLERARNLALSSPMDPGPCRDTALLDRLGSAREWIAVTCTDLSEASALGQRMTPIVEWILDNQYIIESNILDVQQNLSKRFYRELPMLENEPFAGLPRIYGIAKQLVHDAGFRLDRATIVSYIEAYQIERTLTTAELWAIPQMLRIAVIEGIFSLAARGLTELRDREIADYWANRLITAGRRGPNRLFPMMAHLTGEHSEPSPYFAFQLVDHLYDEESALFLVQSWLERIYGHPVEALNGDEQDRQAKGQIAIGNAFTTLRGLAQVDWRDIFEEVSRTERILRSDPAGVYPRMDFATRDRYRRRVELLARRSGRTEEEVAQAACDLSAAGGADLAAEQPAGPAGDIPLPAGGPSDPCAATNHVGAVLIGERRSDLETRIGTRPPLVERLRRGASHHHTAVYLPALALASAAGVALFMFATVTAASGLPPWLAVVTAALALIPISQLAVEGLNYLVARLLPPNALAKMDFEDVGIPESCRTLVVVPMLLTDVATIDEQLERLEVRYLANREENLLFGLFTDYTDSDYPHADDDELLLRRATDGLRLLNERYNTERFYHLHRERVWSESEQKFIGWERKRGKLEELSRMIDETRAEDAERLVYLGDREHLFGVRFVITLDSDTQLPSGSARRMIETIAHPLNRARLTGAGDTHPADSAAGVEPRSYTIIQPRVSPSLPSTTASLFSRLFSDAVGIDPYTRVVSDVYQDLAGEGSYHGKGIFDVGAFNRVLTGRFPEERLLSHDLLEGAHVRVGLASDIELIDEFPPDYRTFATRLHRWIRGDWQIAAWILPRVPGPDGRRTPNPLSLFDRWKIADNLRRSLLPVANLLLLLVAWLTGVPALAWSATLVVTLQLLFGVLAHPFTMATTRHGLRAFSSRKLGHDLLRVVAEASLLPRQALLAGDAIARAGYRLFISHRKLLEWTVHRSPGRKVAARVGSTLTTLGVMGFAGATAAWMLTHLPVAGTVIAAPWLAVWMLSPIAGLLLNREARPNRRRSSLSPADLRYLRRLALKTWRYYSQFVTERTSWLPPDNYQVSHQDTLAMRTSPTNIGLYLLSVPAAHEFGYLTTDEVIDRLTRSMGTIAGLERFAGHLLNWYDIESLKPLEPRYVSTVDSGNLLGTLWSLEHAIEALIATPLLDERLISGLRECAEAAADSAERRGDAGSASRAEALSAALRTPPEDLAGALALVRRSEPLVPPAGRPTVDAAPGSSGAGTPADGGASNYAGTSDDTHWSDELGRRISALGTLRNRYLRWAETLAEKNSEELEPLGTDAAETIANDLQRAPSLSELATGDLPSIRMLAAQRDQPHIASSPLREWIDRVLREYAESRWLAGEALAAARQLVTDVQSLSESIDMRFLYDPEHKHFPIGFNVTDDRPDDSFYDLLASEARIGSFIAIARGEVPVEHWFTMGRPYNAIDRRRVLLSWSGTMFEYLMPQLLLRSFPGSLLDKAAKEAVAIQIAYGRRRGVPWGISESAFSDLDINRTYQYKAFGVPHLGLKRGLEDELVVAPYASVLAMDVAPKKAVVNLRRLDDMGLLQEFGFYDAIDFSRRAARDGERGVIVRTYMSHHQGMSFLALTNYLHGGRLRTHFLGDPRARAFEPLLHECIPSLTSRYLPTREGAPSGDGVGEVAPTASTFDTPHTATPKTQLLGNGRYSLMITNSGGGYSQWRDFEITRWRADTTRDTGGIYCYIHEPDTGTLWSNTYHPTAGEVEPYRADFAIDRALFRRVDDSVEVTTEVVVSPEDDVEVRRITLINRSSRERRLSLTSYIELSLAAHRADLQHPAFNKLFIQTEAMSQHGALIAYRRPRRSDDPPIFVAHRFTSDHHDDGERERVRFDSDRRTFIGRGRTLANPIGATAAPAGEQGFVLDPILSLRRTVTLGPGERQQVSLILAAGESRQRVVDLMDKYDESHAIDRAMGFAWASAQIELRSLRIQPDDARRFQQIASHLLFPNSRLRPPTERLLENRMGQAGLWPYGISGDVPILLVTIADSRDIGLVRQALRAHSYWRAHGFAADIVIVNEEAPGYERPLRGRLEALNRAHGSAAYLLSADQLPREHQTLLMSAARVVLVAARGSLPQQMGLVAEPPQPPKLAVRRRSAEDSSPPLPFMELHYFNGIGGFTDEGREYAIYLGDDTETPTPWVNVMANPHFGTIVSESGAGFTWAANSQRNRITDWSNDPVADPASEALYIRDEESGEYWTPTASPIREPLAYRARHGAGYSVFEHNSHGIEQELTVFVPVGDGGGDPVKIQRLRLKNHADRPRTLSVTYYLEWTLGENRESSQMHVTTEWNKTLRTLFARNRYNPDYGDRLAFATITPAAASHGADRTMFIGRNRSLAHPAAMERTTLSSRIGGGLDPCSALRTTVEIAPGATGEVVCVVGQTGSIEQARDLIAAYGPGTTSGPAPRNAPAATGSTPGAAPGGSLGVAPLATAVDRALETTKQWWDNLLGTFSVHTPEYAANFLINRWLLYQSLSCRMWGRSATYQSGGAFGFRDQLQDAMAFVYTRPDMTREQIVTAAARQFSEGDVQHWWHPPTGAGIRSRISDDLLWLPYVAAHYVRITGDHGILEERIPFLSAPPLEPEQHELFLVPDVGDESGTLFEHCRRAVERGLTSGPHGLPLIGTGDWNDGMNLVGAEGRGESVWLAWFLVDVLRGMTELADFSGDADLGRDFARRRDALIERIEETAWDGKWYLRAYFDDGTPLGSSANGEASIDSLPQSWARLTGAGNEERTRTAMESARQRLVDEETGLVSLFDPPFDTREPSPGYIKGYPPGVRENGGQYTHAALWFAMALARGGDGEGAAGMLRLLNPIEHAREPEAVLRYAVEPYVVAADVYRLPGRVGRGGWSWYTGSAAWMYRAWIEEVLGLTIRADELRIDPVIPAWWDGFSVRYRHGRAVYEIQVDNPDGCEHGVAGIVVDGKNVPGGTIDLERDEGVHRVTVLMGHGSR